MIATSSLIVFLGVVLSGRVGLGLAGVAAHHGWVGLLAVFGFGLLGKWARRAALWRLRHRGDAQQPTFFATLLHALRAGTKSTLLVLVVPLLGYVWGHLTQQLPWGVRWLVPFLLLAAWGWLVRRKHPRWPRNAEQWREVYAIARQHQLPHVVWLVVGALWLTPSGGARGLLEASAEQADMQPDLDSLQWIDEPFGGLRTAFTSARALVLIARPDAPNDVFLVRFGLSHDGVPARIVGTYNISNTAAVEERDLHVWQRWAAWTIQHGDAVQSIELADLRHEAPGKGEGWTQLKRAQQVLENRQKTGQWRGIGRARVELLDRPRQVRLELLDGALQAVTDARTLRLDLGRPPTPEMLGEAAVYGSTPSVLPGAFVPWLVDRLRATAWIGSQRMQWLKGWVFRAGEHLEALEHRVVGIDPHEAVAEELGDVLESLPLAEPGQLPGWPPEPLAPPMKPALNGEGKWVTLADDIIVPDSPGVPSPFVFTFIRTDSERAYIQTSITMWDPRQVELHIVAGTEEPKSMTGDLGSGTIVREPRVLRRLVGAFNGAFQAVHGEFGMMERGRVQLPPKPYAATVATYPDGTTGFGTWPKTASIPTEMTSLRQNLTPLVLDGKLNPYRRTWWGGVPEGWTEETRTVRSGMCLTVEGYVGYFYSPGITPDALGKAMLHARCSYGVHLDMNAGHTGFELYRVAPSAEMPQLLRPLDRVWEARGELDFQPGWSFFSRLMVRKMPLMNFPRYVHTVSRDFFYLTRRELLPGPAIAPLAEVDPGENDGKWRVADIDGHGFPYAISTTTLTLPEGARARITRLDPKQLRARAAAGEAHVGVAYDATDSEQCIWHRQRALWVAAEPPGDDATPTVCGSKSKETRLGLACVDQAGMLVLGRIQPANVPTHAPASPPGARAALLTRIEQHLNCEQTLYLGDSARLVVDDERLEGRSQDNASRTAPHGSRGGGLEGSSKDAQTMPAERVAWFTRDPLLGVKRIFEDTPVLAPNDWALLQRRRVEYVPTSDGKREPSR